MVEECVVDKDSAFAMGFVGGLLVGAAALLFLAHIVLRALAGTTAARR